MNNNELLGKIYYDLGKQSTNFAIQHSRKEGEEIVWSKRKNFLELNTDDKYDNWLINNVKHRQILLNEIIIDIDRKIDRNKVLEDPDVHYMRKKLLEDRRRFIIYHTGSKGVHIHIFIDLLILKSRNERETFRKDYCKRWLQQDIDLQKCSDNIMIALELVPHWKTGIQKIPITHNKMEEFLGETNG